MNLIMKLSSSKHCLKWWVNTYLFLLIKTSKSAESRQMLAEQQNETSSGHRGPITAKGPGRPRRPKRRGRPRMGGRSRCSGRLSRPGQSPSKSLSSVSAEHNVFRRKARLKEVWFSSAITSQVSPPPRPIFVGFFFFLDRLFSRNHFQKDWFFYYYYFF